MEKYPSIGSSLRYLYLLAIIILIIIYTALAKFTMHYAENSSNGERLKLNAPYFFTHYEIPNHGHREVTPLTTIYANYNVLPLELKEIISEGWTGYRSLHVNGDHNEELDIFGQKVDDGRIMYAIERVSQIEVNNTHMLLFLITIGGAGLITFIFISYLSIEMANRISKPFIDIANQLTTGKEDNAFTKLASSKAESFESNLILCSINQYRQNIKNLIKREKSFSRYISHELRTPMTVIKGSLSVLRKKINNNEAVDVLSISKKIDNAVADMEQLTLAILTLSREQQTNQKVILNQENLAKFTENSQVLATTNNVALSIHISEPMTLDIENSLLSVLIQNLLNNAINCSLNGNVQLFIDSDGLSVIDDGSGLNDKPRGYEGFGVGLHIVRDICKRYNWQFELTDNKEAGCTATVEFNDLANE